MKNWLYPGAKVVCVDDERSAAENATSIKKRPHMPVAGRTYTVRAVAAADSPGFRSPAEVWLEEIINPIAVWNQGTCECGFGCSRFRPLHDNSKIIEDLKQAMIDHVNRASGGLGIRKPVRA